MFAHIIDTFAERDCLLSPQTGNDSPLPQIPSTDPETVLKPITARNHTLYAENAQINNNLLKNIVHENIENAIHPRQDRLEDHHSEAKDWNAEIKRLNCVPPNHGDFHHDFAQRLFSIVGGNVGSLFSFYSHSAFCEKRTGGSHS